MSEESKHVTPVLISLMAISGGVARYAQAYIDGRKFSWFKFIASMPVAMFTGTMFSYFGKFVGAGTEYVPMFAGLGGYYGGYALHIILDRVIPTKDL